MRWMMMRIFLLVDFAVLDFCVLSSQSNVFSKYEPEIVKNWGNTWEQNNYGRLTITTTKAIDQTEIQFHTLRKAVAHRCYVIGGGDELLEICADKSKHWRSREQEDSHSNRCDCLRHRNSHTRCWCRNCNCECERTAAPKMPSSSDGNELEMNCSWCANAVVLVVDVVAGHDWRAQRVGDPIGLDYGSREIDCNVVEQIDQRPNR